MKKGMRLGAERPVALVDLDGTLADYDARLEEDLRRIASPHEPPVEDLLELMARARDTKDRALREKARFLEERRQLITTQPGWFAGLPKFKLGWDVLGILRKLDYRIEILTQGPLRKPGAWKEKLEWCHAHVPFADGITITRNKSITYGRVLVDDWPDYIRGWLEWRSRGLVIMPAHPANAGFRHPQVIRYDGGNLREVREALRRARKR